jgi:hypothetical protein
MDVLFLGGPWHRQRHTVPDAPPDRLMVIPDGDPSATDLFADLPEPVGYDLRRQRNGQWPNVAPIFPPSGGKCGTRPRRPVTAAAKADHPGLPAADQRAYPDGGGSPTHPG